MAQMLDRLNPAERELLILLGRGHTAKSIATLKGLSVAAVNERFRSARRKTGVASSREIARLLVTQENRDDLIGLVKPTASPPDLPRPDAPRHASPQRWRLTMAAAVLIAAAILAQQTSVAPTVPPAPSRPISSAAQALFVPRSPEPDISALHTEVMGGGVAPKWSAATETALRRIYGQAIAPDALASFEVTCSASLCEALGVGRPGLVSDAVTVFTDAVQGPDVNQAAGALGLHSVMNSFIVTRDDAANAKPSTLVFAAYWRRID